MQHKYFELIWLRSTGELKADVKNSHLGLLWWILEPLLLTGLIYLAFSSGIRGSRGAEFMFLILSGILPFKWTASCITGSANSLFAYKGIMGQVYLPKWIFPTITNLTMAIRFTIVLPLLLIIMSNSGIPPSVGWLTLGYVVLCQLVFNIGVSYLVASWVPLIPDLTFVIPLLIMALMFTSGIFFDINDRSEEIQEILRLNPFVEIIDNYRAVLLRGETITLLDSSYAWSAGLGSMLTGFFTFKVFDRYYPRVL